MKRLLIKLLLWITGGKMFLVPAEVVKILPQVKMLCSLVDKKEQSGEWKRHQVYASLIKLHPEISRRNIALAIEVALSF